MRLGFVLDRGVTFAEAKRWFAGTGLDKCTAATRPAHLHGRAPVPRRAGRPDARASGHARRRARAGRGPADRRRSSPAWMREQSASLRPGAIGRGPGAAAVAEARRRPGAAWPAPAVRRVACGGRCSKRRSPMPRTSGVTTSTSRPWPTPWPKRRPLPQRGRDRRIRARELDRLGLGAGAARDRRKTATAVSRPVLQAGEAAARLRDEMAAAVGAVARWHTVVEPATAYDVNGDPPPPWSRIKAGAGLGKTGSALEQIAAVPGIEPMGVRCYVPDHRLAEELAEAAHARPCEPPTDVRWCSRAGRRHGRRYPGAEKADLCRGSGQGWARRDGAPVPGERR